MGKKRRDRFFKPHATHGPVSTAAIAIAVPVPTVLLLLFMGITCDMSMSRTNLLVFEHGFQNRDRPTELGDRKLNGDAMVHLVKCVAFGRPALIHTRAHALSEQLQRWGKWEWIKANNTGRCRGTETGECGMKPYTQTTGWMNALNKNASATKGFKFEPSILCMSHCASQLSCRSCSTQPIHAFGRACYGTNKNWL